MSQATSPAPYTPVESPNSLISSSRIKITDILCEGPISGFAIKSGVYGSDPLCSTFFDDVQVRNIDGSYNFNASGEGFVFDYRLGITGQSVMDKFEKVETAIPLSSNTLVSKPPANAGSIKNVVASFNSNIYPDADMIKITMKIPALYHASTKGDIYDYQILWSVDISLNNGPFVEQEQRLAYGKCTSPYLTTSYYPLPKTTPEQDFYEWKVRVRRTSENIMSAATQNELFVDSICVVSNSSFSYPSTALVGVQLSASQFNSIPSRAYEIMGTLISLPMGYKPTVYNGDGTITQAIYPDIWDGQFDTEIRWTDNPAWIFYDLLTNKRYGLGNYIKYDWVDKWTLYEIAQYCDELVDDGDGGLEPRFTCNVVLQQRKNAYDLLMNLASIFRGMLYWTNGRLFSTFTNDRASVYNFTNANVIDGKFNYSDTAKNTRSTVIKVRWTDPQNLYRESIEYVEDTDGIIKYGYIEKDITAFACTSKGQAMRIANWALQTEKLLTETVTFQVGLDGNFIRPGDLFNVYDNFRNNSQQGGRVKSFNGTLIELDRTVNLRTGFNYALSVVNPKYNLEATGDITGSNQTPYIRNPQIEDKEVIVSAGGDTTFLYVNEPYTNINNNAIWILYTSGSAPSTFLEKTVYRCLALSESVEKNIEILGLIYRTGLNYSIETGYTVKTVPVIRTNTGNIDPPSGLQILLQSGLQANNKFFSYYKVLWTGINSPDLAYYQFSGQKFGGSWEKISYSQATYGTYQITNTGRYDFKIASVSNGNKVSTPLSGFATVSSSNPLGGPPRLSGIYISENYDINLVDNSGNYTGYLNNNPKISWVLPKVNGLEDPKTQFLSGYNIYILDNTDTIIFFSGISLPYTVKNYKLNNLAAYARFKKIYIETVDIYGNTTSGASLKMNNPIPNTFGVSTKFYSDQENLFYNISPNPIDQDISGVYLWYNTGSVIPTFNNFNAVSSNLNGTISNNIVTGVSSIYWSLVDTFGTLSCAINGPTTVISTNASIPTGVTAALNNFSGAFSTSLTGSNSFISGLQNQVNVLITGLQTEITNRISGYTGNLALITGEQYSRITGDAAETSIRSTQVSSLSGYIIGASGFLEGTKASIAYVDNVTTTLVNASGALVSNINTQIAQTNTNIQNTGSTTYSLIQTEITNRTNADSSEASQRNSMAAGITGYINNVSGAATFLSTALINNEASTRATNDTAEATERNLVAASLTGYVSTVSGAATTVATALVNNESSARTTADSAEASQRNTMAAGITGYINSVSGATFNHAQASIDSLSAVLVTTSGVLASQTTNVQAKLDATGAIVQTLNQAFITGGQAVARWGMTVTAGAGSNRAIAGIEAVASNGESPISAIRFLANILQVCSTVDGTTYYPFQIVSGTTYINEAMIKAASITQAHIQDAAIGSAQIQDAAIDSAKIGSYIQSSNYVAHQTGWKIQKDGNVDFGYGTLEIAGSTFTYDPAISGAVLGLNSVRTQQGLTTLGARIISDVKTGTFVANNGMLEWSSAQGGVRSTWEIFSSPSIPAIITMDHNLSSVNKSVIALQSDYTVINSSEITATGNFTSFANIKSSGYISSSEYRALPSDDGTAGVGIYGTAKLRLQQNGSVSSDYIRLHWDANTNQLSLSVNDSYKGVIIGF